VIAPDLTADVPAELGRVHFIGIGGSGMSGIARMFRAQGLVVTGSDRSESQTLTDLRADGIVVQIGHEPIAVRDADTVVVTGALWADNPEYRWAIDRGIRVLHRALALAWLVRDHRVVSVAGAHGKTTSTAMIVTGLLGVGRSPSFVNGGVLANLGASSGRGTDSEFVIEADESDGSFVVYPTSIGLITNIDSDHLEHYGSEEAFDQAFVTFANGCREVVVVSGDDPALRRLMPSIKVPSVTFGESEGVDYRVSDIESSADGVSATITHGNQVVEFRLPVAGAHNAVNGAGAIAVMCALGVDLIAAAAALGDFAGTGRRFELTSTVRGVRVYDDYAHHPREVRAALATARSVVGDGRLIAVHQPHLYSRTRDMAADFAREYESGADFTVVLDVFGAREDPIAGVSGALVAAAFPDQTRVAFCPDWSVAAKIASQHAQSGDIIMTLSCGDVYRIIPQIVAELDVS
jgi:UDP-N-acetylmuramate--alanine ligase